MNESRTPGQCSESKVRAVRLGQGSESRKAVEGRGRRVRPYQACQRCLHPHPFPALIPPGVPTRSLPSSHPASPPTPCVHPPSPLAPCVHTRPLTPSSVHELSQSVLDVDRHAAELLRDRVRGLDAAQERRRVHLADPRVAKPRARRARLLHAQRCARRCESPPRARARARSATSSPPPCARGQRRATVRVNGGLCGFAAVRAHVGSTARRHPPARRSALRARGREGERERERGLGGRGYLCRCARHAA